MSKPSENQVRSGYPRAIVHVDGDAFFASCEVAKNPKLRGRPVVVGGLRGIAVALTYEAKARGVVRGMPVHEIRKLVPDAVILPGDHDLYGLFAERMYAIVGRYTPIVEEYSVDECFAELVSGDPEDIAKRIKYDLETELGVSFSVGLATTKVLAKVASKINKPSGLVCIPLGCEREYLAKTAIGKIWGIGRATNERLYQQKIETALQFVDTPEWWIKENMSKPHRMLWYELHGTSVYEVSAVGAAESEVQKSLASTRTFRPPTTDARMVWAQLSKNIEEVARRARVRGITGAYAYCFLKSQEFQYLRFEVPLAAHTNAPTDIIAPVRQVFERTFKKGIVYRATGITLADIRPAAIKQQGLFDAGPDQTELFAAVDRLDHAYGDHTVHLGSSMAALGDTRRMRPFNLPFLGEVR